MWLGFSTSSYVEYNITESGDPRTHREPGLGPWPLEWNRDEGIQLTWYLATSVDDGSGGGVAPNVIVRATIHQRDGEEIDPAGALLASGESGPTQMVPVPGNPAYAGQSGNAFVYRFDVPMAALVNAIPVGAGFSIRIQAEMDSAACDLAGGSIMPIRVEPHSSPDWRPQLEVSVRHAVWMEYVHPQFVSGELVVHVAVSSAWGAYDVDESPTGTQLSVRAPDGTALALVAFHDWYEAVAGHGNHSQLMSFSATWDYGIPQDGVYVFRIMVRNDQGNAETRAVATLQFGGPDIGPVCPDGRAHVESESPCVSAEPAVHEVLSPAAGSWPVGILLGAAVFALRRRRFG